jgi:SAM-dependent methyltransferase
MNIYASGRYWRRRSDMLYYQYFRFIVRCIASDASSMLDVGSGNSPYLEWFDWIPERVSVDLATPYQSEAVRGIEGNIFNLKFEQPFDICSCMQVLEHVPEPEPFARRLLELGRIVLISVPHKWPQGSNPLHVNDPVDINSLEKWFGRKANYHIVVREPFHAKKGERLFAIYDVADPARRFGNDVRKGRRPA